MTEHDTQAIIDVATRATVPNNLGNGLFALAVPPNASLKIVNVEDHLAAQQPRPRRKTGTVTLSTPASLSQYVNTHKGEGTELWSDWTGKRITAVLNDHDAEAGWGDHRAVLVLRETPEWKRWTARNGQLMEQATFAEHVEECLTDIADPDGATLLELVSSFQAYRSVDFKSGTRLQDGNVSFRYEETTTAKAGQRGELEIPAKFLLAVSIFEGMEAVAVEARLRWRLTDGHLAIGYLLDRTDVAVREAVEQCVTDVEGATELTALRGTPRS